jgi:hypothetical protein
VRWGSIPDALFPKCERLLWMLQPEPPVSKRVFHTYMRSKLKCAVRRGPDYFLMIGVAAIFLGISIIVGIVYTYADIRYAQADRFLGIHDFPADL